MVTVSADKSAIADVHCLNCGRLLAVVVRSPDDGKLALRPTLNQSSVQVLVAGRNLLRCGRCGGRAFVEPREETPVESLVPAGSGDGDASRSAVLSSDLQRRSAVGRRFGSAARLHSHGFVRHTS